MAYNFKKVGEGTVGLARNFGKAAVYVALDVDVCNYWGKYKQKNDIPVNWSITGVGEVSPEYVGVALIRKGKVHFYDRYPCGGGPFRIKDFEIPSFRKRAELIAKNIESLLKE